MLYCFSLADAITVYIAGSQPTPGFVAFSHISFIVATVAEYA